MMGKVTKYEMENKLFGHYFLRTGEESWMMFTAG